MIEEGGVPQLMVHGSAPAGTKARAAAPAVESETPDARRSAALHASGNSSRRATEKALKEGADRLWALATALRNQGPLSREDLNATKHFRKLAVRPDVRSDRQLRDELSDLEAVLDSFLHRLPVAEVVDALG